MNDFLCPKCREHIRVGDNIIFKVKNSKKQSGLLLLSPQIGNYTSIKHPYFEVLTGEYLEFFCPLCGANLVSDIHKNLARVILQDETGKVSDVYFSQIVGEHSTYETDGDSVRASGADAGRYTYFKVGGEIQKIFLSFLLRILNILPLQLYLDESLIDCFTIFGIEESLLL